VFVIEGQKISGKLKSTADSFELDYRMVGDQTIEIFLAEAKRAEELGRQGAIVDAFVVEFLTTELNRRRELVLGDDRRSVVFGRPPAPSAGMDSEFSGGIQDMKPRVTLVRAKKA